MKKLTKKIKNNILSVIDEMVDKTTVRLLGTYAKGRVPNKIIIHIVKDINMEDTLEGIYAHAASIGGRQKFDIDKEFFDIYADEVNSVMSGLKDRAAQYAIEAVQSGAKENVIKAFERIESEIERVATTETRKAQSMGQDERILKVAQSVGVADPVICFIGPLDAKTCKVCLTMYHCKSNPRIPRVHKFSEINRSEYLKLKNWDWKEIYPSGHSRCRHSQTIILAGFGFDQNGSLKYFGEGHDEYKSQRDRGD